jgi:uncharacterized protein (TIGR02117 family)
VARRRRKSKYRKWVGRVLAAILALPGLYLLAALIGSLIPVNRGWTEADQGTTVFLADNGIHTDIVMPVKAQGLDWAPLIPKSDFAAADPNARWIAFGSGEERVYLNTPTWWDLTLRTIWSALAGGRRVMHVEYVSSPSYAVREIRLRPEEYRRLWAAIRTDFAAGPDGKAIHIDHPGYGPTDAFYWASGKANAIYTCNAWTAHRLRLAGVQTSLWTPFVQGLVWRYRKLNDAGVYELGAFFTAASNSVFVIAMTRPLSPLPMADAGILAFTAPVDTTTPSAATDSTLPTAPPFGS